MDESKSKRVNFNKRESKRVKVNTRSMEKSESKSVHKFNMRKSIRYKGWRTLGYR